MKERLEFRDKGGDFTSVPIDASVVYALGAYLHVAMSEELDFTVHPDDVDKVLAAVSGETPDAETEATRQLAAMTAERDSLAKDVNCYRADALLISRVVCDLLGPDEWTMPELAAKLRDWQQIVQNQTEAEQQPTQRPVSFTSSDGQKVYLALAGAGNSVIVNLVDENGTWERHIASFHDEGVIRYLSAESPETWPAMAVDAEGRIVDATEPTEYPRCKTCEHSSVLPDGNRVCSLMCAVSDAGNLSRYVYVDANFWCVRHSSLRKDDTP